MKRWQPVHFTFIGILCLSAAMLVGCQREVVHESYSPPTKYGPGMDYEYHTVSAQQVQPRSQTEPSFMEKVGDALFGWMQSDEPEPTPPPRERRYDPIWQPQ